VTFLLSAVPAQNAALWRSPWEGVVSDIVSASYVLLPDGRVLGVCAKNPSSNPSQIVLGYAASVAAFVGGDGSMVVDRVLVNAAGGSSASLRTLGVGLCVDPDDSAKLLLVFYKVQDNATWTYGSGFPAPSALHSGINFGTNFLYESTDAGVTWTETTFFQYAVGGFWAGASWGIGPVQKFGSLYLVAALTDGGRRSIFSSADKVTWTHRYRDDNRAGVGAYIAQRDGKFYTWGESGLASSTDGLTWSRYDTSLTENGGAWFTYSLDGGMTTRHGVIRRNGGTSVLWQSTTTADPVPTDFATDTNFDATGYTNQLGRQPLVSELGSSHLVIANGPRIFAVKLLYGGWSVGSFRLG